MKEYHVLILIATNLFFLYIHNYNINRNINTYNLSFIVVM